MSEEFSSTSKTVWDAVYEDAARETGKSVVTLRVMATQVFATILHHMIQERDSVIWTAAKLEKCGRFSVEVNILPRFVMRSNKRTPLPDPLPFGRGEGI